ncbi:hypothetical protein F5Y03DRAFT_401671 [Xylaria venustula]|nr:hypothetical protein F5Y03DRAFT_401671 [Xylaria venustula]
MRRIRAPRSQDLKKDDTQSKRGRTVRPSTEKKPRLDKTQHLQSPVHSTHREKTFEETQGKNSQINEQLGDYFEVRESKKVLFETSDSRHLISQASAASTAEENALEALARGLLNQKGLDNLWPQIVAEYISRSDARHTIDRFLQGFGEDLECLATTTNGIENEESRRMILSSSMFF